MHYSLFVTGLAAFLLILFFLPETSHPGARGVDKALEGLDDCHTERRRSTFVFLNPLSSLALLRSPNLMAMVSVLSLPALDCF